MNRPTLKVGTNVASDITTSSRPRISVGDPPNPVKTKTVDNFLANINATNEGMFAYPSETIEDLQRFLRASDLSSGTSGDFVFSQAGREMVRVNRGDAASGIAISLLSQDEFGSIRGVPRSSKTLGIKIPAYHGVGDEYYKGVNASIPIDPETGRSMVKSDLFVNSMVSERSRLSGLTGEAAIANTKLNVAMTSAHEFGHSIEGEVLQSSLYKDATFRQGFNVQTRTFNPTLRAAVADSANLGVSVEEQFRSLGGIDILTEMSSENIISEAAAETASMAAGERALINDPDFMRRSGIDSVETLAAKQFSSEQGLGLMSGYWRAADFGLSDEFFNGTGVRKLTGGLGNYMNRTYEHQVLDMLRAGMSTEAVENILLDTNLTAHSKMSALVGGSSLETGEIVGKARNREIENVKKVLIDKLGTERAAERIKVLESAQAADSGIGRLSFTADTTSGSVAKQVKLVRHADYVEPKVKPTYTAAVTPYGADGGPVVSVFSELGDTPKAADDIKNVFAGIDSAMSQFGEDARIKDIQKAEGSHGWVKQADGTEKWERLRNPQPGDYDYEQRPKLKASPKPKASDIPDKTTSTAPIEPAVADTPEPKATVKSSNPKVMNPDGTDIDDLAKKLIDENGIDSVINTPIDPDSMDVDEILARERVKGKDFLEKSVVSDLLEKNTLSDDEITARITGQSINPDDIPPMPTDEDFARYSSFDDDIIDSFDPNENIIDYEQPAAKSKPKPIISVGEQTEMQGPARKTKAKTGARATATVTSAPSNLPSAQSIAQQAATSRATRRGVVNGNLTSAAVASGTKGSNNLRVAAAGAAIGIGAYGINKLRAMGKDDAEYARMLEMQRHYRR